MTDTERGNDDFEKLVEIVRTARQREGEANEAYEQALKQMTDSDPQYQELKTQHRETLTKMVQTRHRIMNAENELAAMKTQYKEELKLYKQLTQKRKERQREIVEASPDLACLKDARQEARKALMKLKTAFRIGWTADREGEMDDECGED